MKGRIGPYRVSERIGTGGMGEVFKAFDDRLNRWVAIKRIRPGKEDTDENRERFLREARATAQLNHSSIVHVYDIFRDGDSDCIVMEYVEGRTLQSMTAEGPLDPLRAIELAREVAEGLAAAHAKNILHRDLKTENIIVSPDGHAKILDFGLAKPLISEEFDNQQLTGKGQLVGTSRAMSPEYVGGDKVDHRSDLFALGVLLYETVTGHSPFKAQNTLATLKQVIVHQQPPTREVNPEVPQEFSDLIDRLLEKSPEDRPQSAREVAAEIARISGQHSSGAVAGLADSPSHDYTSTQGEWSISTTMTHPRLRRYWITGLSILVAALIGAYLLGRLKWGSANRLQEEVLVVLGDFENLTDDRLLDDSLDVAFRTGLEQSRFIKILPENRVQGALERMKLDTDSVIDRELGIEICQREGAQVFVIGSIVRVGQPYSVSAEIIDAESQDNMLTARDTVATQGEILGALQKIVEELRAHLGESVAALESSSQPLEKVTTSNLEALKAYSLGLRSFKARDYDETIALFNRAIELDPEFAMAHVQLGVLYQGLGRTDKVTDHFDEARKYSDRMTSFERLYVDGWQAILHENASKSIKVWTLVTDMHPEYAQAHHNIGMLYWLYMNEFEKATAELEVAVKHNEGQRKQGSADILGYCKLALGQLDEALELFEDYGLVEGQSDALIALGRYAEAQSIFDTHESFDNPFPYQATFYLDQGQFSEARSAARANVARTSVVESFMAHLVLIEVALRDGNESEALSLIEESVERAKPILQNPRTARFLTPVPFLAMVGKISARLSALDQAKEILELIRASAESSGMELWISYTGMLEGEILLAEGRVEEAVQKFEETIGILELFQARESLARAFEVSGDTERAIQENLWIYRNRGRAFSECFLMCSGRPKNIVDWASSLESLSRLYKAKGELKEAEKYETLLENQWRQQQDRE